MFLFFPGFINVSHNSIMVVHHVAGRRKSTQLKQQQQQQTNAVSFLLPSLLV